LESRKLAILDRGSLQLYSNIKPLDARVVASYLTRRGLGTWLKLKLRTDSLPLLESLGRHCKPPLSLSDTRCRLCESGAAENVSHFLSECDALSAEREEFLQGLLADESLMDCPDARSLLRTWRSGSSTDRVCLILSSHELPRDRIQRDPRGDAEANVDAVWHFFPSEIPLLTRLSEPHVSSYLVRIWRKRAALLGGVPALDVRASSLVTTHLLEDGRCRVFAAGVRL
jgi:hypothetical protein